MLNFPFSERGKIIPQRGWIQTRKNVLFMYIVKYGHLLMAAQIGTRISTLILFVKNTGRLSCSVFSRRKSNISLLRPMFRTWKKLRHARGPLFSIRAFDGTRIEKRLCPKISTMNIAGTCVVILRSYLQSVRLTIALTSVKYGLQGLSDIENFWGIGFFEKHRNWSVVGRRFSNQAIWRCEFESAPC